MNATVSERGQVTVPKAVRDALGLHAGVRLEIELVPGGFVARKRMVQSPWREVVGRLDQPGSTDQALAERRGEVEGDDE